MKNKKKRKFRIFKIVIFNFISVSKRINHQSLRHIESKGYVRTMRASIKVATFERYRCIYTHTFDD